VRMLSAIALTCVVLSTSAAAQDQPKSVTLPRGASPADAAAFMTIVEKELDDLQVKAGRAQWVSENFITDDTEALSAEMNKNLNVAIQRFALDAKRFDKVQLPPELRRKFTLLKLSLSAPPPSNPTEAAELSTLTAAMPATYGKGTYCRPSKASGKQECLQINDLSRILATSTKPAELLDAWRGWHSISRPIRPQYTRFVDLSNKGARELGFRDAGAMWRSNYDMTPEQFTAELERIWNQVRPLYLSLHAYVRAKLAEKYGNTLVPPNGLIPAHLLGNMWAQEWGNIFPLVAPKNVDPGYDLTQLLKKKNVDAVGMAHYAERFFTSMGLAPLPGTFWERSLFTKPRDREVVCHASAYDVDNKNDVRVKTCLEQTGEDFVTIHHEEGHDFYYLAYKNQPTLFQNGANDGFHEAIGDAIALAITPAYLKTVGLLDQIPPASSDTMLLLRRALDKVAFLPFGLLIDQWRWKVFSGEIKPANYNAAWWDLRKQYQGVAPPLPRSESDFDPGAKYHVPANTPYTRYFLAAVLQFQFYRAMCREAGQTGPLYRCTFYGSKAAGKKLEAMLSMGQSQPWPEVLYAMTGERQMDGGAMMEYFAPLKAWLDVQNRGKPVGW
jgi:peptidyl-dipeptidase A